MDRAKTIKCGGHDHGAFYIYLERQSGNVYLLSSASIMLCMVSKRERKFEMEYSWGEDDDVIFSALLVLAGTFAIQL